MRQSRYNDRTDSQSGWAKTSLLGEHIEVNFIHHQNNPSINRRSFGKFNKLCKIFIWEIQRFTSQPDLSFDRLTPKNILASMSQSKQSLALIDLFHIHQSRPSLNHKKSPFHRKSPPTTRRPPIRLPTTWSRPTWSSFRVRRADAPNATRPRRPAPRRRRRRPRRQPPWPPWRLKERRKKVSTVDWCRPTMPIMCRTTIPSISGRYRARTVTRRAFKRNLLRTGRAGRRSEGNVK